MERISCAVSMYGYVSVRYMSLEGMDFTWENEYQGDHRTWPHNTISDASVELYQATAPTLFLHGLKDDVCPPSQSKIAFSVLNENNVPTGNIYIYIYIYIYSFELF